MKRVYSCLRPVVDSSKSYSEWFTECDQKLSISCRGLIAFTSSFCINLSQPKWRCTHLYVCDINSPYQPYLLSYCDSQVTLVEWDQSGTKLLVADINGNITIYTSKNYLISDWKPYYKKTFAGETFLAAAWYHPGVVSSINVSNQNLKKPSNHLEYPDKINLQKYGPSLRVFGGKSAEGCLLVSCTGLICCLTLIADGTVDCVCEGLGPLRSRVFVADVCHHKDGSFIVATSVGKINSTISMYQINLTSKHITMDDVDAQNDPDIKRVFVSCRQYHSFHPNVMSQMLNERENGTTTFESVSHIKFMTKDSPNDVLIEAKGQNLSLIELWELETKKKHLIHPTIAQLKNVTQSASGDSVEKKVALENGASNSGQASTSIVASEEPKEWSFKGNYIAEKDLMAIQTPKSKMFGSNRQLNLIILAYKDYSICCMRKEDLQPMYSLDLSTALTNIQRNGKTKNNCDINDISPSKWPPSGARHSSNGAKMIKLSGKPLQNGIRSIFNNIYLTDISFTCNQSMFVAIDSMSQLHAIQLPPLIDCQDDKDHEIYLQYLIEYCLVTGNDWWDVIVSAKQDSIEAICDEFQDAYERQPKNIQRKYFNKQLMIRASLYRCLNKVNFLSKSSDCYTTIMLNSIANTLKSMIRSDQQDQDSLTEELAALLKAQPLSVDLEHVLGKIGEPKDFQADPSLIQSVQPLIQWVSELAIYLVVSLPQRCQWPGSGLLKSKEALETIRELLVIIKIWTGQKEAISAFVHKRTEQGDFMSRVFKLVSILYATMGAPEPESSFVDECLEFSRSISIPDFCFLLKSTGVASPLLFSGNSSKQSLAAPEADNGHAPLEFVFCSRPSQPELVKLPGVEGAINFNGERKIDVVRQVSLGAHPVGSLRMCTRCQSVSMISPSSEPKRYWEQRWLNSCLCGGSWTQSDVFFPHKCLYFNHSHVGHHGATQSVGLAHQLAK